MKTVVITGANAGIGFATAKHIAGDSDWHVVLACRNSAKAKAALEEIHKACPGASVSALPLDLLSLQSISDFAASLEKQDLSPLHGLVLNAGGINMQAKSLEFSKDGFEHNFNGTSSAILRSPAFCSGKCKRLLALFLYQVIFTTLRPQKWENSTHRNLAWLKMQLMAEEYTPK